MNDHTVLENYVKMYSNIKADGSISPEGLKALLNISYNIAMDNSGISSCIYANQIINAAVVSCVSKLTLIFHNLFKYKIYILKYILHYSFMVNMLYL